MKFSNWQAFDKHVVSLQRNGLPPVICLLSKDEFELKEAFSSLLVRLSKILGVEKKNLPLKQVTGSNLRDEFGSMSLFSPFSLLYLPSSEELKADDLDPVEEYLCTAQAGSLLLITGTSLTSALCKKIEAGGLLCEVADAKPWEKQGKVQDWVMASIAKEGKTIQREAAFLLAKEFTDDRFTLKEELHKLVTYTQEKKEITLADVQAICTLSNKSVLWQLSEVILQRNKPQAIQILHGLPDGDLHPLQILRYLRNQVRNALEISALHDEKVPPDEIMKRFPTMKGKTFDKNYELATGYGTRGLTKALLAIDKLEVDLKNSAQDEQLALEMLILSL